jgi:putative ATP-dependent endonuclease of the OLD family
VVRARGKASIVSLCKILNQFAAPYSVLHDSDRPKYLKDGKDHANPAWALNDSIRVELAKASVPTRLLASLPNFEGAYLGDEVKSDKPYNVLSSLKRDSEVVSRIAQLLDALIDFTKPCPPGAMEWTNVDQLMQALEKK